MVGDLQPSYLLPKLKPDLAVFEKKMAEYADAVVVSAAILQRAGMPAIVQAERETATTP